jgi:hypothetical protein
MLFVSTHDLVRKTGRFFGIIIFISTHDPVRKTWRFFGIMLYREAASSARAAARRSSESVLIEQSA